MGMTKFERQMLENQCAFAEELWALLKKSGMREELSNVSKHLNRTRQLLDDDEKEGRANEQIRACNA